MPEVIIYGMSDDLFEVEGCVSDEFDCYDTPITLELEAPNGEKLIVIGEYAPKHHKEAMWSLGVSARDEDDEGVGAAIPPWPIRIERKHKYSPALIVDVPDGTKLKRVA